MHPNSDMKYVNVEQTKSRAHLSPVVYFTITQIGGDTDISKQQYVSSLNWTQPSTHEEFQALVDSSDQAQECKVDNGREFVIEVRGKEGFRHFKVQERRLQMQLTIF